jgi:hypothetical protein
MRRDRHFQDRFSDNTEILSSSLILVAFHQAGSLQHQQMINDCLWPDIKPLSHLIKIERAKGEELKYAPPILVPQDI